MTSLMTPFQTILDVFEYYIFTKTPIYPNLKSRIPKFKFETFYYAIKKKKKRIRKSDKSKYMVEFIFKDV